MEFPNIEVGEKPMNGVAGQASGTADIMQDSNQLPVIQPLPNPEPGSNPVKS